MRGFMAPFYVDLVQAVFNDKLPVAEKKAVVVRLLMENLATPLTNTLNSKINIPLIGEQHEHRVFHKIVETGIVGLVDRSVDALDGLVQAVNAHGTRDLAAPAATPATAPPAAAGTALLSERQMAIITKKVNDAIDIPLLSEKKEEKIFSKIVHEVNEKLEGALQAHLPGHYVNLVRALLNDQISTDEKQRQVNDILRGHWQRPLSDAVNRNIDIPLLGEHHETKIFHKVIDYILRGMVHYLVEGLERSDFV
eukprot:TRINITY_DN29565_c0_g1_i2.p1 TRINITY_DN29565_c0_g1~~TRINITY_DN29565_c0_g1_i2.p1  ORF type:complete len:252 (+),score=54.77 TRINITY_DN29565_c0_g1_i2:185-940(+)